MTSVDGMRRPVGGQKDSCAPLPPRLEAGSTYGMWEERARGKRNRMADALVAQLSPLGHRISARISCMTHGFACLKSNASVLDSNQASSEGCMDCPPTQRHLHTPWMIAYQDYYPDSAPAASATASASLAHGLAAAGRVDSESCIGTDAGKGGGGGGGEADDKGEKAQ